MTAIAIFVDCLTKMVHFVHRTKETIAEKSARLSLLGPLHEVRPCPGWAKQGGIGFPKRKDYIIRHKTTTSTAATLHALVGPWYNEMGPPLSTIMYRVLNNPPCLIYNTSVAKMYVSGTEWATIHNITPPHKGAAVLGRIRHG